MRIVCPDQIETDMGQLCLKTHTFCTFCKVFCDNCKNRTKCKNYEAGAIRNKRYRSLRGGDLGIESCEMEDLTK